MGHKAANPTHIVKCLPRMSWSPANLYNLYQRTYGPPTAETKFTKSSFTMFQQKWKAKRLVRAYHGDWIEEKRFKKFFLPDSLPPIVGKKNLEGVSKDAKVPLTSMMFAEVEKRLDTVVFRCCFADSVYKARQMVVHGKVKLNGKKHSDPHTRLQPGDLISVDPDAVSTLQPPKPHEAASNLSKVSTGGAETSDDSTPTSSDQSDSASSSPKPPRTRPLPFHLPEYAAPFLFVPHYIEPSFSTCSAIYLRHPTASPGHSEVPSPYQADGEVMKLAWEYYAALGRKGDKRPPSMVGQRLGS